MEHKINSLEDLCNLANKNNIEILAEDVKIWLTNYVEIIEATREEYPKETKDIPNTKIARSKFIWVDDGKNDVIETRIIIK